ncbi:hypothetical protein UlMin_014641 [Ulmus minor]
MKEQDQEQKHVCKLCNKSFLNGKVLGGHMRCHPNKKSVKGEKRLKKIEMDAESSERGAYGLRVNPKKSCKVSGSNNGDSGQDLLCQVCGKGFDSLRALFGHMRHHPGKRRKEVRCKECDREFDSLRALTGHMKSHSERFKLSNESSTVSNQKLFGDGQYSGGTPGLVRRKRSRRSRYKITPNSSLSNLSESSFAAEYDQEVEEVALCLMMLSRGIRNCDGFSSGSTESSDNTSATFDDNSLIESERNLDDDGGGNYTCSGDGSFKMKKKPRLVKLECCGSESKFVFDEKKISEICEHDSAFASYEEKIVKPGKMPKLDDGSYEKESHETELDEDITEELGVDLAAGFGSLKSASGSETLDNLKKKSEYKCRTCNKIFNSHQALGGHQTIHRTKNCYTLQIEELQTGNQSYDSTVIEANCKSSKMEYNEKMELEADIVTMTSYENKEHKCPICFKVFASGQALGGHKRAHVTKDSELGAEQIKILKQEVCNICDVLDVSVPMTLGEQANSGVNEVGLIKPWWVNNDQKHELLVGLIPN